MSNSLIHTINIGLHISFSSLCIILGLFIWLNVKGTDSHKRLGWVIVFCASIGIGTAFMGSIVFRGKTDLIGVSALVLYQLWTGIRSLKLQNNGCRSLDIMPAKVIALLGFAILILGQESDLFFWEPARIYAVSGGMIFYGGWDCLRTRFPKAWRRLLNPAEHAFKLSSVIGALITVASTTLWPHYASVLSLGLSSLFTIVALCFSVRAALRAAR